MHGFFVARWAVGEWESLDMVLTAAAARR
jgi:hypothetical protein